MSGVIKTVKKVVKKVVPREIRKPISRITRPIDQAVRKNLPGGWMLPIAAGTMMIPGVNQFVATQLTRIPGIGVPAANAFMGASDTMGGIISGAYSGIDQMMGGILPGGQPFNPEQWGQNLVQGIVGPGSSGWPGGYGPGFPGMGGGMNLVGTGISMEMARRAREEMTKAADVARTDWITSRQGAIGDLDRYVNMGAGGARTAASNAIGNMNYYLGQARSDIGGAYGAGRGDLMDFYNQGMGSLDQAWDRGYGSLTDYYNQGRGDIMSQIGQGVSALENYYGRGRGDIIGQENAALTDLNARRTEALQGLQSAVQQGRTDLIGQYQSALSEIDQGIQQMSGEFRPWVSGGYEAFQRLGEQATRERGIPEFGDEMYQLAMREGMEGLDLGAGAAGTSKGGFNAVQRAKFSEQLSAQRARDLVQWQQQEDTRKAGINQFLAGTGYGAAGNIANAMMQGGLSQGQLLGQEGNQLAALMQFLGGAGADVNMQSSAQQAGIRQAAMSMLGQLAGQTGANIGNIYQAGAGYLGQLAGQTGGNIANLAGQIGGYGANLAGQTGQNLSNLAQWYGTQMGDIGQAGANIGAGIYGNLGNQLASLYGNAGQTAANAWMQAAQGIANADLYKGLAYQAGWGGMNQAIQGGMQNAAFWGGGMPMYPSGVPMDYANYGNFGGGGTFQDAVNSGYETPGDYYGNMQGALGPVYNQWEQMAATGAGPTADQRLDYLSRLGKDRFPSGYYGTAV